MKKSHFLAFFFHVFNPMVFGEPGTVHWPQKFNNQPATIYAYSMNDIPGSNQNGCLHLCKTLNSSNNSNYAVCYINIPGTPFYPSSLYHNVQSGWLTPNYKIYFNVTGIDPSFPCVTLDELNDLLKDPDLLKRTQFVKFSNGQVELLPGLPPDLSQPVPRINLNCAPKVSIAPKTVTLPPEAVPPRVGSHVGGGALPAHSKGVSSKIVKPSRPNSWRSLGRAIGRGLRFFRTR